MTEVKKYPTELKWAEKASSYMDSRFFIPGTKFKFGFDPVLRLFPIVGEAGTFMISGAILLALARHGASKKVIILMALNIAIDAIFGAIPLLGWVFDFFYKANDRNVKLLKAHYEEGKHYGSGTGLIIGIIITLVLLFAVIIYLSWKLTKYLFSQL